VSLAASGNIVLGGSLSLYEDGPDESSTSAGQSFVLLSTSGTLSGGFANVRSGQRLMTTDDSASFLVTINSGVHGDVVVSGYQSLIGSSTDLTLVVNTITGDMALRANTAMGLSLYNIVDAGKALIKTSAALISKTNTNWQVIKNTSSILAEGQSTTTYNASDSSSFDTIQLAAQQTVDLGDVFNVTAGVMDLTLEFSEPNVGSGDPTTGKTYDGAAVLYYAPEPGVLGVLGMGGIATMRRRRRSHL
jgi:hypothetical protein